MILMITIIMITTQPIPTTAPIRVASSQLPTGVCTNNMYSMHVIITNCIIYYAGILIRSYSGPNGTGRCPVAQCYA